MDRNLSTKTFLSSLTLILIFGLTFLIALHYLLNPQTISSSSVLGTYGGPVTAAPVSLDLDLTSPDDNLLVFQNQILVSGKTSPKAQVLISSKYNDDATTPKSDGTFSTLFNLNQGLNNITVTTFDETGNQKEVTRTIYYSKEKI